MRTRFLLRRFVRSTLALLLAAAPASAQVVEGVDVRGARERARAEAKDLDLFTREVRRRGEAVRSDAVGVRAGAIANGRRMPPPSAADAGRASATGINLDAVISAATKVEQGVSDPRPRFLAFASMSMPPQALRQMIRDVGKAGGVVVFQGFPGNSLQRFSAGLRRVVDRGQSTASIGIDPRLFRAFAVTSVPTYVVGSTDFEPCDGFRCTTALPPHDRMTGNVTPGYALTTFSEGGGPSAAVSRVYLRRLNAGGGGR